MLRFLLVSAVVCAGWAATAQAQLRRPAPSVTQPPAALTAPGGPIAVDLNPAALAHLDAWGLTYVHAGAQGDDEFRERGDALYAGAPLPFGLGIGASAQSIRATRSAGGADGGMFSAALAGAPSDELAFGTSLRVFTHEDPAIDGLVSLDASMLWRPSPHLGWGLMARDVNALVDLTAKGNDPPSSFVLTSAVRPYGTDALTVEIGGAVDTNGDVGVRSMVGVRVPYVGRLHGVAEVDDVTASGPPALRLLGGLAVNWGRLGVEGGVIGGDAGGTEDQGQFRDAPGWYVAARARGAQARGIPTPRYVLDVPVRSDQGARGMVRLARRLERARHDDRIAGVLLRLRSTDIGRAYAQEIRLQIDALREAGKPVLCHLADASGSEYYACAAATRTLVDPAGAVRLSGPYTETILLGELLRKVGLSADFVRIGKYKSAVEQLENRESSDAATEQRHAWLDDIYYRLLTDLSRDLDTSTNEVEELVDEGPYAAPEAARAELVDGRAGALTLDHAVPGTFGADYARRQRPPQEVSPHWGTPPRIGVVVVDGTIVQGDNMDIPVLDIHTSGGRTVSRAIERLARDSSIEAIVVRVDSAGGSALASDRIWRAVYRARQRKPVVASLGAVAASGGYYVASAAQEIWTSPSTLTGSIGIFFGKIDVRSLAERFGVKVEQLTRGEHAGAQSIWRPYDPEERAVLADKIRIWYELFLRRVAKGRGLSVEDVDAVARGRVWSGDAALRARLVDRLGGFASALARARELAGLGPETGVKVVPSRPQGLLDYVLQQGVAKGEKSRRPSHVVPPALTRVAGMAIALARSSDMMPMAMMPADVRVR